MNATRLEPGPYLSCDNKEDLGDATSVDALPKINAIHYDQLDPCTVDDDAEEYDVDKLKAFIARGDADEASVEMFKCPGCNMHYARDHFTPEVRLNVEWMCGNCKTAHETQELAEVCCNRILAEQNRRKEQAKAVLASLTTAERASILEDLVKEQQFGPITSDMLR